MCIRDREESGAVHLPVLAQSLSTEEMSLLTGILQKPQVLGQADQAIADYSNLIQRQRMIREMTEDGDLLSLRNRKKLEEL